MKQITVKELLEYNFAAAARSFPGVKPASEVIKKQTKKGTYGNQEPEEDKEDEKKEK